MTFFFPIQSDLTFHRICAFVDRLFRFYYIPIYLFQTLISFFSQVVYYYECLFKSLLGTSFFHFIIKYNCNRPYLRALIEFVGANLHIRTTFCPSFFTGRIFNDLEYIVGEYLKFCTGIVFFWGSVEQFRSKPWC